MKKYVRYRVAWNVGGIFNELVGKITLILQKKKKKAKKKKEKKFLPLY